jgi:hypothetical protein
MVTAESLDDRDGVSGSLETERNQYVKDGFFVRQDVFDDEEINALSGRVDGLVRQVENSSVPTEEEKRVILKRNKKAGKRSDLSL